MKMQTWVSPLPPDFSDSVSLGGLRTCVCNKFSGDAAASAPGATLENHGTSGMYQVGTEVIAVSDREF